MQCCGRRLPNIYNSEFSRWLKLAIVVFERMSDGKKEN